MAAKAVVARTKNPGIYRVSRTGKSDRFMVMYRIRGLGQRSKTLSTLGEERVVAPLGLLVDAASPWVDAGLSDGSRVHTQSRCTHLAPSS